MALWNRFQTILFGGAIGAAARTAIEPQIEPARQEAWRNNATRVLNLEVVAALRAQGLISDADAEDFAKREGYGADKLAAVEQLAMRAPGMADARTIERRRVPGRPDLHHAYAKAQIEPQFWPALDDLLHEHLSPEVVALAMVRGLIDDQNILPQPPPTAPGKVKQFPRFNLDGVLEALSEGVDKDRLSVLVGISGRPMAPEAAALAVFKGIIEKADYERAVGEGDVRNEWAEAIFENARFRLHPADWAGLWLRGWATQGEAEAGGADFGATPEQMFRLYQNRGRPATVRQTHIGYARGGSLPGFENDELGAIKRAVQESDIRTEWTGLLTAGRYTLPSAFVLRQLTQSGAITGADAERYLLHSGWPPDLAKLAADAWSAGGTGPSTKWADRARSQIFSAAHSDFMDGNADENDARALLTGAGIAGAEQDTIITLWNLERARTRRDLTQAQILKLFRKSIWSRDQAQAALDDLGMDAGDASDLLDSV